MSNALAPVGILSIGDIIRWLSWLALAAEVFGFIDALTHRPEAYVAAGKQTKVFWTLLLGIASVITAFTGFLGLLGLVGVVAVTVYLVDVRPALRAMRGGRGGGDRHMGPYGPW
ncbi:MAG TPA: DUF2516 family protein [Actinomycetes bacterium]|nr:DUF2516 family protein [Actinomycetes bacterium]